jgi:hypothetical protein
VWGKERQWEEAAEADVRAEGVGGRGGTRATRWLGAAVVGAWRPRGGARLLRSGAARERGRRGRRGAGPGRLRPWAEKGSGRLVKQKQFFLFQFKIT